MTLLQSNGATRGTLVDMPAPTNRMASGLERVRELRAARDLDPALAARVRSIKQYQHKRFENDYAALLTHSRYGAAARFFLDDLYGPSDFSVRDAQIARIAPSLQRLLPEAVFRTVELLVELHALSEELDQQMAAAIGDQTLCGEGYALAWRAVGRREAREHQIDLMLEIGRALDAHTRSPVVGAVLHLMRGPARAAGLTQLQSFLDAGFKAFASIKGPQEFLDIVAGNELRQLERLFDA